MLSDSPVDTAIVDRMCEGRQLTVRTLVTGVPLRITRGLRQMIRRHSQDQANHWI
jgi:hypothetical protein